MDIAVVKNWYSKKFWKGMWSSIRWRYSYDDNLLAL